MRSITYCPACKTEFFVTEEQLKQHDGKVRCGQCLQVFDAKALLIAADEDTAIAVSFPENHSDSDSWGGAVINTADSSDLAHSDGHLVNPITDFSPIREKTAAHHRPSLAVCLLLLCVAFMQSIYFLRHDIATYYPNTKPLLAELCVQLACTIALSEKVDLIMIDDTDIQEDAVYSGLLQLSTTLINKAAFIQAYPNLELTLTDVDDKPILRKTLKPSEYLQKGTDVALGLSANQELKLKLAIGSPEISVAGYRLLAHY